MLSLTQTSLKLHKQVEFQSSLCQTSLFYLSYVWNYFGISVELIASGGDNCDGDGDGDDENGNGNVDNTARW